MSILKDLKEHMENIPPDIWLPELDIIAENVCFFQEGGRSYVNEFDIAIHNLDTALGPYYKKGLMGFINDPERIGNIESADIGKLMKELNRVCVNIGHYDLGTKDNGRTIEASLNKILIENGVDELIRLPTGNISPCEVAVEIFGSDTIYQHCDEIIRTIKRPGALIDKLYEPIMVTPLWEHQKDALKKWLKNDCQGYVDMATATGKTVLGIATIASLYGRLHPLDSDLNKRDTKENIYVLIVAHDNLVLEQWRRGLDEHLDIPQEITGLKDTDEPTDVYLRWGTITFVTSQALRGISGKYDLVILDEIHSYPGDVEIFSDHIVDGGSKIIALSGSIDVTETQTLEIRRTLDKHLKRVKEYTLTQAKRDGIIPRFDWNVVYTGYGGDTSKLETTTQQCKDLFDEIREYDENPTLKGYDDLRLFAQTREGIELKEYNEYFRLLAAQVNARRMFVWNQAPSMDVMTTALKEHVKSKKCLVLLVSNEQVKEMEDHLKRDPSVDDDRIWTIAGERDAKAQRDLIDDFDEQEGGGVLIGTGKRLGVGVDIKNVEVVLNMVAGRRVNKTLIQRMGRMLRNPEGKRKPVFYNFVPIPTTEVVSDPREDGKEILEAASQYLALGDVIERRPAFSVHPKEIERSLRTLEEEGRKFIKELIEDDSYLRPSLIGVTRGGKKDSITYLKEDILGSTFPEEGSLLVRRFGIHKRKKVPESAKKKVRKEVEPGEEKKGFDFSKVKGTLEWFGRKLGEG